jgi:phage tail-like protein
MSERARVYRFARAAQWQLCLRDGFDVAPDGSLLPIQRLGSTAYPLTQQGPISLVAADPMAGPVWRMRSGGRVVLIRQLVSGDLSRPFEVDATLAGCPRWLFDRQWLWGFDSAPPIVRRYESATVSEDLAVDLSEVAIQALPADFQVRDLASDGRAGAWLLLAEPGQRPWLLHLDCGGRPAGIHPVPSYVRCGEHRWPDQIVGLLRGTRLVLLAADGQLVFVDAATGGVLRTLVNWTDDPCWRAYRLASDAANRVLLLCHYSGDETRWAVFVLDADGNVLDVVKGPQEKLTQRPDDVATSRGIVWLAVANGLWQVDSTEASVAKESASVLLTPALLSPDTGSGGGWLRAEVQVDLPRGAVLEAEALSTDDQRLADQAKRLAAGQSGSTAQQQQAIYDLFDHTRPAVFHFTEPANGQPVGIPLFHANGKQLWLRLNLVTPPGVTPPAIRELRVLYPDASISQHLPSVFRGDDSDPTGFLRSLVGVLEATSQGIDQKIRGIADQLNPDTAPAAWLDYLARWLDLPWDDALPTDGKRRLLGGAGALLERRGTRRGLEQLIGDLVGSKGRVRVTDATVDYPPMRLGGDDCRSGARLPMVLAGSSPAAPILGRRAVLGRACLGVACDPLMVLTPTVRVAIVAPRSLQKVLDPLLAPIVEQYLPAGVRVVTSWRIVAEGLTPSGEGDVPLDAIGPGRLGDDSDLGRTVLASRGAGRLGPAGLDLGWRLA